MTTENVQYGSNRDLDEIVFENRNKEYGAYDLRKSYKPLLTKAFILGTLLFAFAIILPFAIAKFKEATKVEEKQVSIDLTEIKEDEQIFEEKKEEAAPPPPPKAEEVKQEIIKDVIPEPKVNARNEEPPPKLAEKLNTTTGTINQEGEKVVTYHKPEPAGVPGGTGTAPTPAPVKVEPKVSHTEVYTEVDQEADFSGGGTGAVRSKFQENFDSSAVEGEGTLKTTISFVVERDGSVTDVKASGPNSDFNREAERAFKAIRGKWNPGKKNGENVRSRFRFPVTMNFE